MLSAITSGRKREYTARAWKNRSFSAELQYDEGGKKAGRRGCSSSKVPFKCACTNFWWTRNWVMWCSIGPPDQTCTTFLLILLHFIQFVSHASRVRAFWNLRNVTIVTVILGKWRNHFKVRKFALQNSPKISTKNQPLIFYYANGKTSQMCYWLLHTTSTSSIAHIGIRVTVTFRDRWEAAYHHHHCAVGAAALPPERWSSVCWQI